MYNKAIFILTYKRPNAQHTIKTLEAQNNNIPIYFIVSDDDPTIAELEKNYPRYEVKAFNKQEIDKELGLIKIIDTYQSILYARNYAYKLAKELDLDYFIQLDDDYVSLYNLFRRFYYKGNKNSIIAPHLSEALDSMYSLYFTNPNIKLLAGAQGGDFIMSPELARTKRKTMNFFICKTDRVVKFLTTINEDVSSYSLYGLRGDIFLTIPTLIINQHLTQTQEGGITETYLNQGTYKKSFSAHIVAPSVLSLDVMGRKNYRIHHKLNYKRMPQIISGNYKKIGKNNAD